MTTNKNLADKAIDIHWKTYVQVKDRIQYLSDNYDGRYSMESDYQYYPERKLWVVKATLTVRDEKHEKCCVYNWLAQELESDNYKQVNFSSALENAESSARGRACAAWGCWISTDWWIASADEMNKALNRQKSAEMPSNPEPNWFEKAKQNTKFMQDCLDEDDCIAKIKNRVAEIWAKMTKQQETDLRICYQNAKAMEKVTENLPFVD